MLITKTKEEQIGTHYLKEGSEENDYSDAGCPDGTTIIIRDLFYNTPARMKFLKKDVSEANSCAAVIDRIALSHPGISFKFIRDGKQTLSTMGDGKIKSAVYSVLGREFSSSLIETENEQNGIKDTGLICILIACKPTRNNQLTFLNGRLVRSGTVVAATEQAYKNSAMVGKFPSFVLYINVPFDTVDVNVHPAKTEVRFSDEKLIFESVYVAVKNALSKGDTRPEVKITKPAFNPFVRMSTEEFKQSAIEIEKPKPKINTPKTETPKSQTNLVFKSEQKPEFLNNFSYTVIEKPKPQTVTPKTNVDIEKTITEETPEITVIGEAFKTYIIAQMGDSIFMIDKHAAHERIIFNKLKKERKTEVQALLTPVTVILPKEEYNAVIQNTDLLLESGFETEDFGNNSVVVRAVPATLIGENVSNLLSEAAESLITAKTVRTEREENIFHTVACKAAIKAGNNTTAEEMLSLAEKVLFSDDIMYCPHGRPVAYEIKRRELERQFGRIQ